jgi:hypothetical protein
MLTVGDLLASYGRSLMRVMDRQCVVLYDKRRDADRFTLCPSARKLFLAQEHAAKALLTVLTDRGELRQPLLLGEIGSGKSTTSLVTARSFGARRPLIFCPPHLLDSWKKEVASVFPAADYRVLASASDVDAVASATGDFVVSVLSREAAKLGHRLEGVTGSCPRCGTLLDADAEGRAKKRERDAPLRPHAPLSEVDVARRGRSSDAHSGIAHLRFLRLESAAPIAATTVKPPTTSSMPPATSHGK